MAILSESDNQAGKEPGLAETSMMGIEPSAGSDMCVETGECLAIGTGNTLQIQCSAMQRSAVSGIERTKVPKV